MKYAEVFRGANAFKYGSITLGGAINLVTMTGYEADPFAVRLEGGSYGYFRGQISGGGVAGPFDYIGSFMGRYREVSASTARKIRNGSSAMSVTRSASTWKTDSTLLWIACSDSCPAA